MLCSFIGKVCRTNGEIEAFGVQLGGGKLADTAAAFGPWSLPSACCYYAGLWHPSCRAKATRRRFKSQDSLRECGYPSNRLVCAEIRCEFLQTTRLRRSPIAPARSLLGRQERFPPPRLSGGCGFQSGPLLPTIRPCRLLGPALSCVRCYVPRNTTRASTAFTP